MPDSELPEWEFVERRPMSKQRDPVQGEFFNTESIKTAADEVVREAVQNTLDAAADDERVRVRFFVSGASEALPPDWAHLYFVRLREHAEACGLPASVMAGECRFVVVEDFGTTGLIGD